jgi:hypothetical protein
MHYVGHVGDKDDALGQGLSSEAGKKGRCRKLLWPFGEVVCQARQCYTVKNAEWRSTV